MTPQEFKKKVVDFCKELSTEAAPEGCSLLISIFDGNKAAGHIKCTDTQAIHNNFQSLFEQNPQLLDIALSAIAQIKHFNK